MTDTTQDLDDNWRVVWEVSGPVGFFTPNDDMADAFASRLSALSKTVDTRVKAEVLHEGEIKHPVLNLNEPAITGYKISVSKART